MTLGAFSPDGKRLLLVHAELSARLWDATTGKPIGAAMQHKATVRGAAFDREGKRIVTCSADGTARVWDGASGKATSVTLRHDGEVVSASFSDDGKLLLTAGTDGAARLWRAGDGSPAGVLKHAVKLHYAGFSPDASLVYTKAADGEFKVWNASTQQEVAALTLATEAVIGVDPTGKRLAISRASGVFVLIAETLKQEFQTLSGLMREPVSIQFSADGRLLCVGCRDGQVRLFDIEKKQLAQSFEHQAAVQDATLDAESRRLLSISSDQNARVWDVASGKLIGPTILLADRPEPGPGGGAPGPNPPPVVSVGEQTVVTVNGITGLFTPITTTADTPVSQDERANFLALIDQLKRDNATLQGHALKLAADLQAMRQPPAAPDDFASGVQHALDELQQRLSTMSNPISNFAVRGLKLESSIYVQVTALGSIEYRFVQPGDRADPATLSRLSLDLVPVPRSNLAGVFTANLFQPERRIGALPNLLPSQEDSLEGVGVFSIGEFLQVATRSRAQAYLEALLGTDRQRIALWAQQALLLSLRGVDGQMAVRLIAAGFGSFEALAAATPAAVLSALEALHTVPPANVGVDEDMVAQWIRAARQYLGMPDS